MTWNSYLDISFQSEKCGVKKGASRQWVLRDFAVNISCTHLQICMYQDEGPIKRKQFKNLHFLQQFKAVFEYIQRSVICWRLTRVLAFQYEYS